MVGGVVDTGGIGSGFVNAAGMVSGDLTGAFALDLLSALGTGSGLSGTGAGSMGAVLVCTKRTGARSGLTRAGAVGV